MQTWIRPVSPIRSLRFLAAAVRKGRSFTPDEPTTLLTHDRLAACLADRRPLEDASTSRNLLRRQHDPEFLIWRFSTSMAYQYDVTESGDVSALIRLGTRGGYREAQILEVFSVGPVSSNHLRPLMRAIADETESDFLSILTTPGNPVTRRLSKLGFIPMPNSINFFTKSLDRKVFPEVNRGDVAITGVDIHTW